jgi:DNA-binding transcriptional LysR family regulator
MDLDLRMLRHFLAVVEQGSFTRAAKGLGLSQPAVSQSVQRLERQLQLTLFDRTAREVVLTSAGRALYDEGTDLLTAGERAVRRAVRAGAADDGPHLSVGFESGIPRTLTTAAVRVAARHGGAPEPGAAGPTRRGAPIDLSLAHLRWGQEIAQLERGAVDVAFIQLTPGKPTDALAVHRLLAQPRVAVFPAGHPLAGRATLTMADIADEPILDAATDRDFWLVNPRPNNRLPAVVRPPAGTVEEMLAFVAAGRGMAITVASVGETHSRDDVVFIPIEDLRPVTVAVVHLRDDARPLVRAFVHAVRGELAAHGLARSGG